MRVRTRIVTILICATILLTGLLSLFTRFIFSDELQKNQQTNALKNAQAVLKTIHSSINEVHNKANALSLADVASSPMSALNIDTVAYFDDTGEPIYLGAYDNANKVEKDFPESLKSILDPQSEFLNLDSNQNDSTLEGLLILPEGPMYFVSRTVGNGDVERPQKNTLFVGQYFNPSKVSGLADAIAKPLEFYKWQDTNLPTDVSTHKLNLSKDNPLTVQIDSDSINAFALLSDYQGKPALIIKIPLPTDSAGFPPELLQHLSVGFAVLVGLISVGLIFLFEKFLVGRLRRLEKELKNPDILSVRTTVDGNDELTVVGNILNSTIESLATKTADSHQANSTISTILNSLNQGFFVFRQDGLVDKNHSVACETLMEIKPAGKHVAEVLRMNHQNCQEWIDQLFEETLPFDSMAALGPQKLDHSKGIYISLKYTCVRNADGSIESVVCIATDATPEMMARSDAGKQKLFTEHICKVLKNRNAFLTFVAETRTSLQTLGQVLRKPSLTSSDHSTCYRIVHTIKGGASVFSMLPVQNVAHQFEADLAKFKTFSNQTTPDQLERLQAQTSLLQKSFETLLNESREILGSVVIDGEKVREISFSALEHFHKMIESAAPYEELEAHFLTSFLATPVEKCFSHYPELLGFLAERLGKKIHPLEIEGGELPVFQDPYQELFSTLVHAFRNSLDHGIESPEERTTKGKDALGKVKMHFSKSESNQGSLLNIEISDDGRGLDYQKIRFKLRARGQRNWDKGENELAQMVFEPGFTTSETITETSGRGIGMDAIRTAAMKMNGTAWIESTKVGTTLKITVPYIIHEPAMKPALRLVG